VRENFIVGLRPLKAVDDAEATVRAGLKDFVLKMVKLRNEIHVGRCDE
jgi:hypothetical protein